MGSSTSRYGFYKPANGERRWGTNVSTNFDTIEDELLSREFGQSNILSYNSSVNTGVTDAGAVVNEALLDGAVEIVFPPGNYKFLTAVTGITNHVSFKAMPGALFSKEFNGDLFTVGASLYNKFKHLWINANGDAYTGSIIRFQAGSQVQTVDGMVVTNGPDTIYTIEPNGASVSWIKHGTYTIHSSHVAAGAVIKNTGPDTQACPRFWQDNYGLSSTWWYRGDGLQTFYASDIYSNGFDFTGGNTDAATIRNCRMALFPQASNSLTLRGENMIVTECHFGGDITIGSDFDNSLFRGNVMDVNYTFTDNGPSSSIVEVPRAPFYNLDFKVIDTASLPAASAAMNGTILIENAGTGDRNLILYANSQRFRIDGGANF